MNCAQNIAFSKENGDGYLFSKSVKSLSEKEKVWISLDNDDWKEVKNNDNTLLYRYKSYIDKFPYNIEIDGKKKTIYFTEKRLLTYNPKLASKKRYEINKQVEKARKLCYCQAKRAEYNLLVTSETDMKDTDIYDTYHNLWRIEESFKIIKFIREFKTVRGENKYINVTTSNEFIKEFEKTTNLSPTNYYLTEQQIKQIFNYKI